jgi:hypothetical protein
MKLGILRFAEVNLTMPHHDTPKKIYKPLNRNTLALYGTNGYRWLLKH